jgi:predicted GNAT family acetyltransferase
MLERRQRVYVLHRVKTSTPPRGQLRAADEGDTELVAGWTCGFRLDALGQAGEEEARRLTEQRIAAADIYLWEDPQPVSMAMKTRSTPHGISISLVYTPPEQRNRGYATACVGELSRLLLASGRQHCALFADLGNPAANRVYQRIGYEPACDFDEYRFRDPDEGLR